MENLSFNELMDIALEKNCSVESKKRAINLLNNFEADKAVKNIEAIKKEWSKLLVKTQQQDTSAIELELILQQCKDLLNILEFIKCEDNLKNDCERKLSKLITGIEGKISYRAKKALIQTSDKSIVSKEHSIEPKDLALFLTYTYEAVTNGNAFDIAAKYGVTLKINAHSFYTYWLSYQDVKKTWNSQNKTMLRNNLIKLKKIYHCQMFGELAPISVKNKIQTDIVFVEKKLNRLSKGDLS